jgi:GT2 family glycosyltransferase
LAGDVVLAVWESEPATTKAVPHLSGRSLAPPLLSLSLPTGWGAMRVLHAFVWPKGGAIVDFVAADATADQAICVATATRPDRLPPLTAEGLFAGLTAAGQARALRFLLQSCRAAFNLTTHGGFVQLCRDLVNQIAPSLPPLAADVDVTAGLVLCEGQISPRFGRIGDVIIVSETAVRHNAHLPSDASAGSLWLALEGEAADQQASVVLLGEQSLACRSVDFTRPRASLLRWLEKARPRHEPREYVAACLARVAADDPAAEAALREMQVLFPMARSGVKAKSKPLGGEVELAVSQGVDGLFVSGWLFDPHELIGAITAVSATGQRIPLDAPLHRFARPDVVQRYGQTAKPAGFVTFVPMAGGRAVSHQHRFELALRSGEILHLAAPLEPQSAVEARNLVLGCVPESHLDDTTLAQAIAPAAAGLHARHLAGKTAPEVVAFGCPPARPAVSIVVPLYKVLDFVRFQLAQFATDPAMADVDLIYVLDSPEQRHELEHLLHGLFALYGLPLRLAVLPANFGFAAASNAGAALAKAPTVLFLNSDVIPDRPGWLPTLQAGLEAEATLAAVGPKLLFDDDSLQHAGLYFARDFSGKWYNAHYYKGLPRDFGPACEGRLVPAVTGACLLMRTALVERLGGFSEDYIIGDYEDSDLCLRLRDAGHEIGYVPEAELYHLERQSILRHAGYTRGAACAYNRRLHGERWGRLIEALCGDRPAGDRVAA